MQNTHALVYEAMKIDEWAHGIIRDNGKIDVLIDKLNHSLTELEAMIEDPYGQESTIPALTNAAYFSHAIGILQRHSAKLKRKVGKLRPKQEVYDIGSRVSGMNVKHEDILRNVLKAMENNIFISEYELVADAVNDDLVSPEQYKELRPLFDAAKERIEKGLDILSHDVIYFGDSGVDESGTDRFMSLGQANSLVSVLGSCVINKGAGMGVFAGSAEYQFRIDKVKIFPKGMAGPVRKSLERALGKVEADRKAVYTMSRRYKSTLKKRDRNSKLFLESVEYLRKTEPSTNIVENVDCVDKTDELLDKNPWMTAKMPDEVEEYGRLRDGVLRYRSDIDALAEFREALDKAPLRIRDQGERSEAMTAMRMAKTILEKRPRIKTMDAATMDDYRRLDKAIDASEYVPMFRH